LGKKRELDENTLGTTKIQTPHKSKEITKEGKF
jgi:hypothetical protein